MSAALAQPLQPVITASHVAGLQVTLPDGRIAQLAVVDEHGTVIDQGSHINRAAWHASVHAYRAFLRGTGHIQCTAAGPKA